MSKNAKWWTFGISVAVAVEVLLVVIVLFPPNTLN